MCVLCVWLCTLEKTKYEEGGVVLTNIISYFCFALFAHYNTIHQFSRITVFKDNHPKAQKAQTRVAEKKEAGVKVNIGARGENALESYIAAHPPTRAELLESLETGSSLGLTAVTVDEIDFDDVDDVSKSSSWSNHSQQQRRPRTIDLERRERNHVMAQERKLQHPSYDKMQQARRKLPAWSRRQEIVDTVEKSHVMILAGETGTCSILIRIVSVFR